MTTCKDCMEYFDGIAFCMARPDEEIKPDGEACKLFKYFRAIESFGSTRIQKLEKKDEDLNAFVHFVQSKISSLEFCAPEMTVVHMKELQEECKRLLK